jgi:D-hydroxyproline dehydrogenase subunit beta
VIEPYDDAVVGAGIIGLAHAYHLARRGRRVAVFERNRQAMGASVRNFGMLWPIGQPLGRMRQLALRSLEIWRGVLSASDLWHAHCGSLHLAYRDDERQVLEEFASLAPHDADVALLPAEEVRRRAPLLRREGLLGGLFSPAEICVDPRQVIAELPGWLTRTYGVTFHFQQRVTHFEQPLIRTTRQDCRAERLWVCSGDELETLYPEVMLAWGLRRCKLQMLRSQPLGDGVRLGPMLAGGLTLRHYAAFTLCPSLAALQQRVARETPEFDRFGIHVMASQNGRGEVVIGDSHEYDQGNAEPFNHEEIDRLILDYLAGFLDVPGLRIAQRWQGIYVKHPNEPYLVENPAPGATIVNAVGGNGMTLSFGLAEEVVGNELGASRV